MMRLAVIRGICALACAIAFHAALVTGAAHLGWLSPDDATLPELDLTSVDLSFSDTPDETAAPVAQPPAPAIDAPPPPPPPETQTSEPPPIELPPDPQAPVIPRPAEPLPTDLRPPLPTPPEPDPPKESPPPEPQQPSVAAPAAPAPSQARVAVDKPPSPRRRIKPEYPKGARQRGEEGMVTLKWDVLADGKVSNVQVIASCGFVELEQAAIKAIKSARFKPARNGQVTVPYAGMSTNFLFQLKR